MLNIMFSITNNIHWFFYVPEGRDSDTGSAVTMYQQTHCNARDRENDAGRV
jgi:hypothetical protein